MREKLRIDNKFGIKPTNNCKSAGADFYMPYFDESKKDIVFKAFEKSYNVDKYYIENTYNLIKDNLKQYDVSEKNICNSVMLFLALHSAALESFDMQYEIEKKVKYFVEKYLVFDEHGIPGITLDLNDTLFVNSGIRVILFPHTAGIFLNKSGKGNAGFDVRAQVVDEDYTGFVHISVAYTKDTLDERKRTVYCGDKLIQMVVIPVINCEYVEISSEEYDEIMKDSERGTNMLGSSDIKH